MKKKFELISLSVFIRVHLWQIFFPRRKMPT